MNEEIPALLHVLFGAEVGGCETNAEALIRFLPHVRHKVLIVGSNGPMVERFRAHGATVHLATETERRSQQARIDYVSRMATDCTAAMLWHGLIELPYLIRSLNRLGTGIRIAVHGGNPAHSMPIWVNWKFTFLGKMNPPAGPLPIYICCSDYVAKSFDTSRYLRRFPRVVVPNGVPILISEPHLPVPFDKTQPFVIGMLARLDSIKDHPTLLRAFQIAHKTYPNLVLELAGAGDRMKFLISLAEELQLGDSVRFLGQVSDVPKQLKSWDLFAYATTDREGMGNAVAEAMMVGLPCVVTKVGPMELFAGVAGNAVQLVPPYDPDAMAKAIIEIIEPLEARQALATRGYRMAMDTFHPSVFANRYAEHLGLTPCPLNQ